MLNYGIIERRRLQLTEFQILKEFDRVCKLNNISYILSSGTLLGAVRHSGFIPWDDDIDIDITRDEYNRLLQHIDDFSPDFYVQTWHNNSKLGVPMAKIRMNETVINERATPNQKENGIYIDVIPCDKFIISKDENNRFKKLNKLRGLIFLASDYKLEISSCKLVFASIIQPFVKIPYIRNRLIQRYEYLVSIENDAKDDFKFFENCGGNPIGSWIIDKECFENVAPLEFEGLSFPGPADVDLYLKSAYGDYMKLPSIEVQENLHHDFTDLQLKKIKVLTVGVFDYFHYGHLKLFERARRYGNYLTVAVQKDEEIHKTKPNANILYDVEKRKDIVSSLKCVDRVVEYSQIDEDIPKFDFDVFVVGGDQVHAGFQRAIDWCKQNGKQVIRLERTEGISSSYIKGNIK